MPIIKSAEKALRQNIRRKKRNIQKKAELKTVIKHFRKLITDKKNEEAKNYLSQVFKKLDKSAKANVIKKNKASRLKSRLSKKLGK